MRNFIEVLKRYNFFNQKFDRFSYKEEFKNKVSNLIKELRLEQNTITESTLKDRISDILNFFYNSQQKIIGRVDLKLKENGKDRVFFEFKSPFNTNEMVTTNNLNKKAMWELIVYFRDSINVGNNELKWLIITNGIEWFIFSVWYFYDNFVNNPYFQKIAQASLFDDYFDNLNQDQKYKRIEFFLDKYKDKLVLNNFYYFNLFTIEEEIAIKTLFCLLSPEFLLEKYNPNKSNILNKKFYDELLYMMGLKEDKIGSKKLIIPNNVRNTFFDQIFERITDKVEIKKVDKKENSTDLALELLIIWFNRILFLKLFEARLKDFNDNNPVYAFMSNQFIEDFSKLNYLFFHVLAKPTQNRKYKDKFANIPYLNSSLFEKHSLEELINISELINEEVDYYPKTVLKDKDGNRKQGKVPLLTYLFDFLDAYDFGIDNVDSPKDLISPAVLGLVFEKINGYKDGSYYTPTEITDYIAKESIELYIVNKYNELEKTNYQTFNQLFNAILSGHGNLGKLQEIVNEIKICDPAVGSGHFLVSALNFLLLIKWHLGLFENVAILKQKFDIDYIDGDLVFKDRYSNLPFKYRKDDNISQLFQETLFKEKRYIIENNLFGVDINPKSVEIARLRLWIELLKNAYYTKESNFTEMQTLPNVDINIKVADSLLTDIILNENYFLLESNKEKIFEYLNLWKKYQETTSAKEKKEIKNEIQRLKDVMSNIENFQDFVWTLEFPQIIEKENIGFDVIIGNPPYISTKEIPDDTKQKLKDKYQFVDDLYNHFFFRGLSLLKNGGILGFITSKTYWTIQTKKNLRNELLEKTSILQIVDTKNPFAPDALVDTCIIIVKKQEPEENHKIKFKVLDNNEKSFIKFIEVGTIEQKKYLETPNNVIFIPREYNLKIFDKIASKTKKLLDTWWDKISSSKNIEKYKSHIDAYRKSLKPGDITLLGLITEGGQGLATGNNGRYIGVLEGTKWAEKVKEQRPEKLLLATEFCNKQGIKTKKDAQNFLDGLSEKEIRKLFDELKEEYGRDIFGQGWLYRIVSPDEIADVDSLTDDEKKNGICGEKTFVPYDKGDKEGNRWYAPTPYYIDWSRENVKFLKENSGKKGEGMPVVRNPQFYFREGFCWTDVNSTYLKARVKENGVYDVLTMSLFTSTELPDWYFVCLINSKFISEYVDDFVNSTSHFQINDARQLPIIIPNHEQLKEFENIFNKAYAIQKQKFLGSISEKEAEEKLEKIQKELDNMVESMYLQ